MEYNHCLRMIILSALVIALLTNGVGGGTAISIILDKIVIQFNETTFQTFYHCLCTTPYECQFSYKNTSNVITIQSYSQFSLVNQNVTFFDAFLCTIPKGTFSCYRLTTEQLDTTVPVNEPDKCSSVSYGNQTCFPRGVALLWAMGTYKVNITSENISQTNNCPDVISLSTSVMPSTTVQDAPSSEPPTTSLIASASSSVDNPQTSGYLVSTSTQPYSSAAATLPSESVTPSNVESAIALTVTQTPGSLSYMSYDYTQASLSLDPISSSVSTSSLLTLTTESLLTDSDGVTQLEPSSLFQSITHSLLTTTEWTTPALHISTLTLAPDLSFTTTRGQPMTTAAPATNSVPLDASLSVVTNVFSVSSMLDVSIILDVTLTSGLDFNTPTSTSTTVKATSRLSTGSWPTNSGMISGSVVVTTTLSLSDIAPTLSSSYTSLGFVSLSSAPGTKTLDTLTQSGSTRTDTLSNSALTSGAIDASATASLYTSLLIRPSMTDLTYTGVVASTINPSPSQPTTSDSNYGSGGHSSGVTLHPTASSSLSTSSPPPANATIPPPGLNSRQEDDRDKIIAITVGVIGGVLFIFAIIIAIFCWRRRQKDRSYETMDAQSTSSDQRSDTSEEIPSKTPDAVNFDGIIPRFPNYKDYNGWDTFRPPYFTMIDIGPTAHNIIKGSVVSPEDATLTKKSSFKKKSSMKSVQFVNPLVEEIEPDYDATVSISSNGQPKKGIIVKTVKFKNTVTESNDFEDVPKEDTDKEQSYEYPHQTSSDYDYATVSFSGENRDSHGTYDTLGTVSDSPAKTSGPPSTSFQSNTPNGHTPNNTVEESTHF
ncbi:serine-rich adhesin for platelets-like isoform X3 [Biomphalaria glabrata]|uniref:Serine-rich adhesin for platelets-like isoform X3 n=1 Tax=Biomphalaria glabrata TaxID=6526 RepID=A0A9W2YCD1_BIOGL|nr:serine-rich adhesin for platelets-like isoform X3 [Biomphalaria glabrata]